MTTDTEGFYFIVDSLRLFSDERTEKMLVLKDFFGYRTTFRNERNGTKGAKGRGVWSEGCGVQSEGRGPLWGGRAEDVTAPRGRRSDPKRL